ncbi:hypothetical protein [Bradyrhizobium diazoefficiens]
MVADELVPQATLSIELALAPAALLLALTQTNCACADDASSRTAKGASTAAVQIPSKDCLQARRGVPLATTRSSSGPHRNRHPPHVHHLTFTSLQIVRAAKHARLARAQ